MIVYQLINRDKQEMLFGTTDLPLEQEIERVAKDVKGPTAHWKKGDFVEWRPLTSLLDPAAARALHRDLEQKTPPNKYRVLPTYRELETSGG
jgi:hypothetical protein